MTSNPTIFDKAIEGSGDYDAGLRRALESHRNAGNRALVERLIIEDIQAAADVFGPLYRDSDGLDGFVSLEVSPSSAHDTEGTIAEARHLWHVVARPNVMIKVPATREGIPAVEALTAEGINVNITLMFSRSLRSRGTGLSSRPRAARESPAGRLGRIGVRQPP